MNNIKLIIFDMDGTLYNLDDVVSMNYTMQLNFYSSYTGKCKDETISIFEENNIFPVVMENSKSATEFFSKSGIPISEWNSYREKNFDFTVIKRVKKVNMELLKQFQDIAPLILLSSNSINNIMKVLRHIGIESNIFDEVVCSDQKYSNGLFNKHEEMLLMSKRLSINSRNMISIGDRFKTDVEPLLKLGGMGVVVNNPVELEDVLKAIKFNDYSTVKFYKREGDIH